MKYCIIIIICCFIFTSPPGGLLAGEWGESMLGKKESDNDGWGKGVRSEEGEWGENMWEDEPDKWGKDIETPKDEWGEEMFPGKNRDDNLEDMPGGSRKPHSPLAQKKRIN